MPTYSSGDVKVEIRDDLDSQLAVLAELKDAALAAAEKIAGEARGMAPVGSTADRDEHPGEYRDSIRAEATKAGARVAATAPHAPFVEFGVPGRGIPAQHILRRAAAALGFAFKTKR